MTIRAFNDSDFKQICSWWDSRGEIGPLEGMLIKDGTFVLEIDGRAVMSLTCYITQSCIGYIEGFIADPELGKAVRRIGGNLLWGHCVKYAAKKGVKHLLTYAGKEQLVKRYQDFGFKQSIGNLTVLYRSI